MVNYDKIELKSLKTEYKCREKEDEIDLGNNFYYEIINNSQYYSEDQYNMTF